MSDCDHKNCSPAILFFVLLVASCICHYLTLREYNSKRREWAAQTPKEPVSFQEQLDSIVLPSVPFTEQEKKLVALDNALQVKIDSLDEKEAKVVVATENLAKVSAEKLGWTLFSVGKPPKGEEVLILIPDKGYCLASYTGKCGRQFHWKIDGDKEHLTHEVYWTSDHIKLSGKLPADAEAKNTKHPEAEHWDKDYSKRRNKRTDKNHGHTNYTYSHSRRR